MKELTFEKKTIQDKNIALKSYNYSYIRDAQKILSDEVNRYNYRQVHSTTCEVPYYRFQRALQDKKSLFREFTVKPPFRSTKDIFCLRL